MIKSLLTSTEEQGRVGKVPGRWRTHWPQLQTCSAFTEPTMSAEKPDRWKQDSVCV